MPAWQGRRGRLRLLATAVALDLLGGALLLFGGKGYVALALAFTALVAGVRLTGKALEDRRREAAGPSSARVSAVEAAARPGRAVWWLAAASIAAVGSSCALIYVDGRLGGREAWPLYTLVAVVVICGLAWSCYLFLFLWYPWGGARGRR